ncbi:hypothetical protein [Methylomonas koyamae]|nr:hypothetical protein [Methylomonas koyamae]
MTRLKCGFTPGFRDIKRDKVKLVNGNPPEGLKRRYSNTDMAA